MFPTPAPSHRTPLHLAPTPLFHSDAEGHPPPEAAREGGDGQVCKDKLLALVVDDAPDVTEMLAMLMRVAGYDVTTALSAPSAFDAARRHNFDVVISDIGMPGMNGYQLAEALRALPGYERVPLIAVTGFSMYDNRDLAIKSGFSDFLTKPINPSDLLAAVERLLT